MADKFYLLDCHASLRLLAMTGVLASASPADFVLTATFAYRSVLFHKHLVIASHVCGVAIQLVKVARQRTKYTKTAPDGRSFVSRILWFFFIGYRRGTRHPSRQPIDRQLCTVCHQILCLLDSFLQRDWLPNHLLSPVQPQQ